MTQPLKQKVINDEKENRLENRMHRIDLPDGFRMLCPFTRNRWCPFDCNSGCYLCRYRSKYTEGDN